MRDYFYDLRYQVDETEWRARAKRDLVFQFWSKYKPKSGKSEVLDLGCGTGVLAEQFEKYFNVNSYGIDISEKAVAYCKQRGLKRVKSYDGKKLPFKKDKFDLVTAIDVVEHIKDENYALSEIKRVLKKKGLVFLLVPAHQKLWSTRDIALKHFRRYDSGQLEKACLEAGFRVVMSKNVDFAIYFLFSLVRKLAVKKKGVAQLKMKTAATAKILNEMMFLYEKLENTFLKISNFPIGLSIFVVAQKI